MKCPNCGSPNLVNAWTATVYQPNGEEPRNEKREVAEWAARDVMTGGQR